MRTTLLDSAEGRRVMRDHRIAEETLVAFRRMLAEGSGGDGSIHTTLSINGATTEAPVPLSVSDHRLRGARGARRVAGGASPAVFH